MQEWAASYYGQINTYYGTGLTETISCIPPENLPNLMGEGPGSS
ncbi:MAG: hypothetical protein M5U19_07630 [Microthrixaceae bacterium]|nr:hypothetical protein [Microthrixaceae bacterium]